MLKIIDALVALFATKAWQLLTHFWSRKLFALLASSVLVVEGSLRLAKSGLPDTALLVAVPTLMICLTLLCVAYLTGQARIDIQARASVNK